MGILRLARASGPFNKSPLRSGDVYLNDTTPRGSRGGGEAAAPHLKSHPFEVRLRAPHRIFPSLLERYNLWSLCDSSLLSPLGLLLVSSLGSLLALSRFWGVLAGSQRLAEKLLPTVQIKI